MPEPTLTLKTTGETLKFSRESGRLVSWRSRHAPEQEFIASRPNHPVFNINYLDDAGQYHRLTSHDARRVAIELKKARGESILTMKFMRIGGRDLQVTATVRASAQDPVCHWGLTVRNRAGLLIADVQYPYVVVSYEREGSVLWPYYTGSLLEKPTPQSLGVDSEDNWQFTSHSATSGHYPGGLFAQFLAYFNGDAGLYLACEDTEANVKLIKPLHREPGIRLGIAHVGDWPQQGTRELEYDIVLRGFKGDWYDAAELYRQWSLRQHWATPLHQREDVPEWLLDGAAYITLRLQGVLDVGPAQPVKEFIPPVKALPFLDRIAERIEAPLALVLMSWERGGPWIYPDCFPPVCGDEGMKALSQQARRRGWRTGSFCNGTRWAIGHFWNDYDGRDYYREHGGEASVCRLPDGSPWPEWWDPTWRPSFPCCMGVPMTREIAIDFVRRLIGWGMESIQFFDQNLGATTFACFARDHDHPPVPGKWMAAVMRDTVAQFRQAALDAGECDVIQSTESPCNETCLPYYQECDVRVIPPGHSAHYNFLPLFHYLYHECIVMQGGMGMGPEPHHLPTRNACNLVLGELPGAVLTGDGTLLNKDTDNWAPWFPHVGSDDDALEVLRTSLALRRGPGRDFLTLGRMLRPAGVEGIRTIEWEWKARIHRIPAVFHAAWQAPDGRAGVVLANWTVKPQKVQVADARLSKSFVIHTSGRRLQRKKMSVARTRAAFPVTIPALGSVLIESLSP